MRVGNLHDELHVKTYEGFLQKCKELLRCMNVALAHHDGNTRTYLIHFIVSVTFGQEADLNATRKHPPLYQGRQPVHQIRVLVLSPTVVQLQAKFRWQLPPMLFSTHFKVLCRHSMDKAGPFSTLSRTT